MINGMRYIGKKTFKYNWKTYLGSGIFLNKAIKKYGRENFVRCIVDIAYSEDELNKLEIQWINNYNAFQSRDFYNVAEGGDGGNTIAGKTQEEIKEIYKERSLLHKGQNNHKSKKVICVNTNEIFDCIRDAERKYHCKNISACCNHKIYYSGIHPETNEPLIWEYYYGQKYTKEEIENKILNIKNKRSGKNHRNAKQVLCVTTGEIFFTLTEASIKYNISTGTISSCCNGKRNYAGKHPVTQLPLIWEHYNGQKYTKQEIEKKINKVQNKNKSKNHYEARKIICLNNNEVFETITDACIKYNIRNGNMSKHLKGQIKTCGKDLITKEPLKWMYYEDYLINNCI